jgi:hypothetical protein
MNIFLHFSVGEIIVTQSRKRESRIGLDAGSRDCVIIGKNVIPNECEES